MPLLLATVVDSLLLISGVKCLTTEVLSLVETTTPSTRLER
jgi:hypothetical protein